MKLSLLIRSSDFCKIAYQISTPHYRYCHWFWCPDARYFFFIRHVGFCINFYEGFSRKNYCFRVDSRWKVVNQAPYWLFPVSLLLWQLAPCVKPSLSHNIGQATHPNNIHVLCQLHLNIHSVRGLVTLGTHIICRSFSENFSTVRSAPPQVSPVCYWSKLHDSFYWVES